MSEVQQIVLGKQFIEEAERHLQREDDFGNGQAVSLAQDAVELMLRGAVRHVGVSVKPKATFTDLIEAIDKDALATQKAPTPHRARIEDINQARISFKHYGTAPGSSDACRLVRHAVEFVETACPQFFDLEWRTVSLADTIRSEQVRGLVKSAEVLLLEGRFNDAMIEAADAVRVSEGALERVLPKTRWGGAFDSNRDVANYLNGLRLVSLAALVQFDVRSLVRFRALGFNVSRSVSGERHVTLTRGQATQESATFGVTFARDFALAVQAKLD